MTGLYRSASCLFSSDTEPDSLDDPEVVIRKLPDTEWELISDAVWDRQQSFTERFQQALLDSLPADQRDAWADRLVVTDQIKISSTEIREAISAGNDLNGAICKPVADYIAEHELYD